MLNKNQIMIKLAKTQFDIHPLIIKRFSPRGYSDEAISKEELNKILEAASWAPSSYNEQPWRFIIGIKGEGDGYDKIFQCLSEKNQTWATTAPILMLSLAKRRLDRNSNLNRFHSYDTGQAIAMLSIQAATDNIFISQMGGFNAAMVKDLFKIPDDYEILAAVALGKVDYEDQMEKGEVAYRTRKDLSEFVYSNDLNTPYTI